jgi:hypothetical protein
MPISTPNDQYDANLDAWALVRDCVKGSRAIKEKKTKYLPKPNPEDQGVENNSRYAAYLMRASFVNFTGHTKDGFMGMIARKESEKNLSPQINYMLDNADGAGASLDEMTHRTISELMEVGRQGLLADFPQSGGGTQAQTAGLRSSIKWYAAESVINWEESVVNGETVLTMVVLSESVKTYRSDDKYVHEMVTQYRELLIEDGAYIQRVFDKDGLQIEEDIIPTKSNKSRWTEIPFVFAGAIDNNPDPDKSPLYDLAELNLAHYRNSADFEESSFIVGQPTPTLMGLTQVWVDQVLKGGVQLGSRTVLLGPEGASAGLIQANENQMPSKGMELKEKQMVMIGAKVITDSSGIETAEAAKIRFAGQNSKLGLIVQNTEIAYKKLLDWADEFMGGSFDNEIEINKQFYEATVNPQLLTAQIMLMDRNVITKTDIRDGLRKSGVIDAMRTDEEIDGEAGELNPLE